MSSKILKKNTRKGQMFSVKCGQDVLEINTKCQNFGDPQNRVPACKRCIGQTNFEIPLACHCKAGLNKAKKTRISTSSGPNGPGKNEQLYKAAIINHFSLCNKGDSTRQIMATFGRGKPVVSKIVNNVSWSINQFNGVKSSRKKTTGIDFAAWLKNPVTDAPEIDGCTKSLLLTVWRLFGELNFSDDEFTGKL